jgi:hypothetical protein
MVNNATGPNGPVGNLLDVVFDDGSGRSGGDQWLVTDLVGGVTYTLTEDVLDDIAEGEDTLPAALLDTLGQAGIQPDAFVNQLLAGGH